MAIVVLSLTALTVTPAPGQVIRSGPPACRGVALTFDMCPVREGSGYDEGLVRMLIERHIPATFFLSGRSLHGLGPYWFESLERLLAERGLHDTRRLLVAAVVVFALLLRSEQLARRFGLLAGRVASRGLRLVRRPAVHGWELATVRFRTRTLELLEHGWVPITAATLVSQLSLYVVLLACLRAVGVSDAEVSWAQVLVAFAFMLLVFAVARLLTMIPFTPGSAGVVEFALIAPLVAAGGDREQVTAAVLVYRALTWGLQIPVGVACYLWWRRSQRRPQPATAGAPQVATPQAAGAASSDRPGTQAHDRRPQGPN